jgi:glyoxylase-like metal-dependent hydrolase (beta-lactamase superfamily II)
VLGTNTYVLGGSDGTCVVIDPGSDDAAIAGLVDRCGLRPERIVLTHGHFDHVLSSAALQRRWDVPVHLHPDDAATLARGSFLMMAMRFAGRVERPECVSMSDLPARLAGHRVRWHHTPGHTPGSCVVGIGSQWFTGDTLYTAGVGLSKLPGEDEGVLRESIRSLRAVLPDADTINPGHGRPGTVSAVWATNRSLAAFLGDARTTTLETGS